MKSQNIVWHQSQITRDDRYQLNNHKSCVLWFTGLSGSGKSTLAYEMERALFQKEIRSYVLDGDNIRHGLNSNLGFTPEDRKENIRRIGEVSKLFVDGGLFVLSAFISPYAEDRALVRNMFSDSEFIEIYVKCSLEECERRDPKGLYQKARSGSIPSFTGISAPYETPDNPDLVIETDTYSASESVEKILHYLHQQQYI
jgi:adenylylsulfate kinase